MMFQSDSIKQTLPRPAGDRACIDFSQDALFGIFGPQKAQIGRLEKIQHKKLAGFFPGPARNRTTARFLKTLYLEFLAPKKLKLDVLRKSNKRNLQDFSQDPPGIKPPHVFSRRSIWNFWPPKSSNWTSWENPTKETCRIFPRTRQESNHRTFSQDALFGIFGPQKAQIGRLEKIRACSPIIQFPFNFLMVAISFLGSTLW